MSAAFIGVGIVGMAVGLWLAWALRRSGILLSLLIAVGAPVLAVLGYLELGQPRLGDLPLADRTDPAIVELRGENQYRQMTGKLAEYLQEHPDNLEGWTVLTQAYRKLGESSFAVASWRRALLLKGDEATAKDWAEMAVLLVQQADGQVTPAAEDMARQALSLDPKSPEGQHLLALAKAQQGDLASAIRGWESLLAGAPPMANWRPPIERYLAQARAQLASPAQGPAGLSRPPGPSGAPGPSPDEVAAARQMSDADRAAMIEGMVEGLAARLDDAPDDPAAWLRLARAYGVLGRTEDAVRALDKAEQTAQARLDAGRGDAAPMQEVLNSAAQMRQRLIP